tara:strand:+ start:4706 stop:5737 length:1032 start_codon:yes stop_codon:yes gene_type:complete
MNSTQSRKSDHIRICTEKQVESKKSTLFECVEFADIDLSNRIDEESFSEENIDCSITLFGKKLNYPIIIAGMTGGTAEAEQINQNLAKSAEKLGIGFGLGSQRAMIENPGLASTYKVRSVAPKTLLLGNIGAAQLSEYSPEQIQSVISEVGADVLAVHLNEIQEALQPEGSWTNYSEKLKQLCNSLQVPVIAKETGMGISKTTAESLKSTGISGIDVGGAGGTSFARVELERSKDSIENFQDSGIPTAGSILEVRKVFSGLLIATGGIRTGSDIAKALALGADAVGIALPLLKPAQESSEAVTKKLENLVNEFKTELLKLKSQTVNQLKQRKTTISGELEQWV